MNWQPLIPPHLANLGVPRRTGPPEADLETIWLTPYPVIRNYKLLCQACGLKPFGGGSLQEQGDPSEPGYINSGYRSEILEGNTQSPHLYGFALDIHVGSLLRAIEVARQAERLYTRVGLYLGNSFVHVDLTLGGGEGLVGWFRSIGEALRLFSVTYDLMAQGYL